MMSGASIGMRRADRAPDSAYHGGGTPSADERWIAADLLVPRHTEPRDPGAETVDAFRLTVVREVTGRLTETFSLLRVPYPAQTGPVRLAPSSDRSLRAVLDGRDPAALRLVLLHFRYAEPAVVSTARLHRAEQSLGRWRFKMALWHDMPPEPPVPGVMAEARAALADALDTPTVLRELHRLEIDQHTASGSKFATFAALDEVLGLDLKHLVGKVLR